MSLDRIALILALCGGIFGAGFYAGDHHTANILQTKISNLEASKGILTSAIATANEAAKIERVAYEENLKDVEKNFNLRADAIRKYYRMLHTGNNNGTGRSEQANNPQPLDEASSKFGISGCPVEIERRCVSDAEAVKEFQAIALKNNWKIAD